MKSGFSEFSYGYALTEDYVRNLPAPLSAAPVFPSLIEEATVGWDLRLETPGTAVMLQFKISDYLKNRSAKQYDVFEQPYYRFKIWRSTRSDQHQRLLDLDFAGNDVNYVAPAFYTAAQFNRAYLGRAVVQRSIFVRPSAIGQLDDEQHYLAYGRPTGGFWSAYVCSKPSKVEVDGNWDEVAHRLVRRLAGGSDIKPPTLGEEIARLLKGMRAVMGERQVRQYLGRPVTVDALSPATDALRQAAHLSSMYFQCQLIVVNYQTFP
jgi:hypothetical protein